jgi:hypothetical protein
MSNMTGTIYNTTDGPLPYDRAGRMLAAREHVDVEDLSASPVAGHVSAGRFIVTSEDQPTEDPTPVEEPDAVEAPAESKRRRGAPSPAPSTQEA